MVISRHQGLLGNIGAELSYGRSVAAVGAEAVKRVANFHPGDPDLELDPAIDGTLLNQDILGIYNAFRGSVRFRPEHLVPRAPGGTRRRSRDWRRPCGTFAARRHTPARRREPPRPSRYCMQTPPPGPIPEAWPDFESLGSNNWVVSGRLSESGYPPHGQRSAPGAVGAVAALLGASGGAGVERDRGAASRRFRA